MMEPDIQVQIAGEIYTVLERLGADAERLAILRRWRDTLRRCRSLVDAEGLERDRSCRQICEAASGLICLPVSRREMQSAVGVWRFWAGESPQHTSIIVQTENESQFRETLS